MATGSISGQRTNLNNVAGILAPENGGTGTTSIEELRHTLGDTIKVFHKQITGAWSADREKRAIDSSDNLPVPLYMALFIKNFRFINNRANPASLNFWVNGTYVNNAVLLVNGNTTISGSFASVYLMQLLPRGDLRINQVAYNAIEPSTQNNYFTITFSNDFILNQSLGFAITYGNFTAEEFNLYCFYL